MKKLISSKTTHQPPTSFLKFFCFVTYFSRILLTSRQLMPFKWLLTLLKLNLKLFSFSFFLVLNETFKMEHFTKTVKGLKTIKYFPKNLHLRCLIPSQSSFSALIISFVYQLIFRWNEHLCSSRDQNPMINFGW